MATGLLDIPTIHKLLKDEVFLLGGTTKDVFEDSRRLYARAILPQAAEVKPDDPCSGGVALRATEEEVWIHPYLFRQVCTNGAIMAQALRTEHIRIATAGTPSEAEHTLRAAIQSCSAEDVFQQTMDDVRRTVDYQADLAIMMMSMLSRMDGRVPDSALQHILDRLFSEGDTSAFGWMNAITSVARDTPDPEQRWRLEEAGGGVPALLDTMPERPRWEAEALPFTRELAGVA